MHTNDPPAQSAVRVTRQWFVWVGVVTAVVVTLFVAGTLSGEWPPHPVNIAIVSVPLLGTATTYVNWHHAQQRVDIVTDLRVELVGLARRFEDTVPLPRAVGTTYTGRGWQAAREAGIIEGYEQGINAAPPPEGGATVLRITDHRR